MGAEEMTTTHHADQNVSRYTLAQLKIAVLQCLSSFKQQHQNNLIGRGDHFGDVERSLGVKFTSKERVLCAKAVSELLAAGLLEPTYTDLVNPEKWIRVSDAGRIALETQAVDELDRLLNKIDPSLCDLRSGATSSVAAGNADCMRQAAHSARELIRQVIARLAPDKEIKSQQSFLPSPDAASGITRKMRLAYIVTKYHGIMEMFRKKTWP